MSRTNTPLQALTLLNHSFTLDMAHALAARLDPADPVGSAYRRVFQRPPSASERQAAETLATGHGPEALGRALLNTNELLHLE